MKRILFIVITGFFVCALLTTLYLKNVFLPIYLKKFIAQQANETLNRRIVIKNIDFSLLKGFLLQDITMYEKDDPQKPFISVAELSFNIVIPAIFKNQAIVIPSIQLKQPHVSIQRYPSGEFNFSGLQHELLNKSHPQSNPLLIGGFVIENGAITYTDENLAGNTEEITSINGKINISLKKSVQFNIHAAIPRFESRVDVQGGYNLKTKEVTGHSKLTRINLPRYLPLIVKKDTFYLEKGILEAFDFDFLLSQKETRVEGRINVSDVILLFSTFEYLSGSISSDNLRIVARDETIQGQGTLDWKKAIIGWAPHQNLTSGDIKLDGLTAFFDKDKNLVAKANSIASSKSEINLSLDKSLFGVLTLSDVHVQWAHDLLEARSALEFNDTRFLIVNEEMFKGDISSPEMHIKSQNNILDFTANASIPNADIKLAPSQKFLGDVSIEMTLHSDQNLPENSTYNGLLNLKQASLKGLPRIDEVLNISGGVHFKPNYLKSEKLKFDVLDASWTISGSLTDFKKPSVNVQFQSTNMDLQKVIALFPNLMNKFNLTILGAITAQGRYQGPLNSPLDGKFDTLVRLENANLKGPFLPSEISDIVGELKLTHEELTAKDIQGVYANENFTVNGSLENYRRPYVDATLSSDIINITSQFNIKPKEIEILSLRGYYLNSPLNVNGHVYINDDVTPLLDINGHIDTDLKDLAVLVPGIENKIKPWELAGIMSSDFQFLGYADVKRWADWRTKISSRAPWISLKGLRFENANIKYEQVDRIIAPATISAMTYDGQFNASLTADLTQASQPFQLKTDIMNLNLAKFKEDSPWGKSFLSGAFFSSLALTGSLTNLKEIQGDGFAGIRDGHLWQMNLLQGIWQALVINDFKDVVFTDAYSDLSIRNNRLLLKNLIVQSKEVELLGEGWIDHDQNIDLLISPDFNEEVIANSASFKKSTTAIITQTNDFLNIRITGTLQKPAYQVTTSPNRVIKKATGIVIDGIKDIFGELF